MDAACAGEKAQLIILQRFLPGGLIPAARIEDQRAEGHSGFAVPRPVGGILDLIVDHQLAAPELPIAGKPR